MSVASPDMLRARLVYWMAGLVLLPENHDHAEIAVAGLEAALADAADLTQPRDEDLRTAAAALSDSHRFPLDTARAAARSRARWEAQLLLGRIMCRRASRVEKSAHPDMTAGDR